MNVEYSKRIKSITLEMDDLDALHNTCEAARQWLEGHVVNEQTGLRRQTIFTFAQMDRMDRLLRQVFAAFEEVDRE